MTPGGFPLQLYRGDTYHWQFVLWSDADKTIPYDLTGVEVKAEIRDRPAGAIITELALTVVPPNTIDADLTAEQCSALPARGSWDLQLTYASGDVATVLAGAVSVTPDITDSTGEIIPLEKPRAVRGARRAP